MTTSLKRFQLLIFSALISSISLAQSSVGAFEIWRSKMPDALIQGPAYQTSWTPLSKLSNGPNSPVSVQGEFSDQQYQDIVVGSNGVTYDPIHALNFGTTNINQPTVNKGWDPMDIGVSFNSVGGPNVPAGSAYYTSPSGNTSNSAINYLNNGAFNINVLAEGLPNTPATSTSGQYYMGKLTYRFNRPVDYPILHVTGSGGIFDVPEEFRTLVFHTRYTVTGGLTLTKLSGTTHTVLLDGQTTIANDWTLDDYELYGPYGTDGNEAGTGSFRVNGTNLTEVTLNVYLKGTADGQYWNYAGGAGKTNLMNNDRQTQSWTVENYTFTGSVVIDNTYDATVSGSPYNSSSPNYTATYATLVDELGNVVQSVPVSATNGTFGFTEVLGDNYTVILTPTQLVPGTVAPTTGTAPSDYFSSGQAFSNAPTADDTYNDTKTDPYSINYNTLNGSTTPTLILGLSPKLSIAGNVYNDIDALTDNNVDNNANAQPASTLPSGLYISLVSNTTGAVIETIPLAADGSYLFNNNVKIDDYSVVLTTSSTGSTTSPAITGWVKTGENCCDKTGDDGLVDGIINLGTVTTDIIDADFGIQQPPTSDNKMNVVINDPNNLVNPVPLTVNTSDPFTEGSSASQESLVLSGDDQDGGTITTYQITSLPLYGYLYLGTTQVTDLSQVSALTAAELATLAYLPDASLPNAVNQEIDEFTYVTIDNGLASSELSIYRIPFSEPLPVKLLSFNAAGQGCDAVLNWKVATEDNFSHYEIERSQNGTNFVKIGNKPAAGNNSTYSYTDKTAQEGNNYYRLKMIDLDGSFEYSNVQRVDMSCGIRQTANISVNPTLTSGITWIKGLKGTERVRVMATNGQLLMQSKATAGMMQIDLSRFSAGLYLVVVDENGKVVYNQKVEKF